MNEEDLNERPRPNTLSSIGHILGQFDHAELHRLSLTKRNFFNDQQNAARLQEAHFRTFGIRYLKEKCNVLWRSMSTEEKYNRITRLLRREDFPELDARHEAFNRADVYRFGYIHSIIEPWRSLIRDLNRISFNETASHGVALTSIGSSHLGGNFKDIPVSQQIDKAIRDDFAKKTYKAEGEGYIFREGRWVEGIEEENPVEYEISEEYMLWIQEREPIFYEKLLEALTIPIEELIPTPVQRLIQLIEILLQIRDKLYEKFREQCPDATPLEQEQVEEMLDRKVDGCAVYGIKGHDRYHEKTGDISDQFEVTPEFEATMIDAVPTFIERAEYDLRQKIDEINNRTVARKHRGAPLPKARGLGPAKNREAKDDMAELASSSKSKGKSRGKMGHIEPVNNEADSMAGLEALYPFIENASSSGQATATEDGPSPSSYAANSFASLSENTGKTKKKKGKKEGKPDLSRYNLGGKKRTTTRRRKSRRSRKHTNK